MGERTSVRRCMIGLLVATMLLTGNITTVFATETDSTAEAGSTGGTDLATASYSTEGTDSTTGSGSTEKTDSTGGSGSTGGMDSATELVSTEGTDSATESGSTIEDAEQPENIDGWVKKNGVWYYYENGVAKTGWLQIGKAWYYLNKSGEMVTGVNQISGKIYCFNTAGVMQKNGWRQMSGKWYYLNGSGAAQTGWKKIGSKWYYMDSNGVMQTGWRKISGKWYYLQKSGAMIGTGWQKLGSKWYYFSGSGAMKSGWQKVSGKWYYLGGADDGAMKTGWLTVGGQTYYLNSAGAMLGGGWHKIDGSWYLMHSSGKILTGWQKVGGKWYYLDKTSGKMLTGWQKIGNKWYYMYSDGSMAKNTYIGQYWVNNSGEWVELSESETGNIVAIRKMFYAVETGGLTYGNCRYDDVTAAYANSSNETAITIGAGQWFATEAQELLNLIRQTDPAMFKEMDTAGIATDLDNENWNYYAVEPDGAKGQCIKDIINTPIGRKCQDQMMDEQIENYMEIAKSAGITDLGGQVMYAETMHLGGKSAANRILGHCEKPYNAHNYYAAVTTTWPEDANYNAPVTSYKTRHAKIYGWIQEYLDY